jgi:hypothetical protein
LYVDLPNIFLQKSTIYHSIKLPFDVEVVKYFLNGIYCLLPYFTTFLYSFSDEVVDMIIDKDEDVDKENEPPVTPLESLPNNTLVHPIVIKKGENLYYQPKSVIRTDDSRTKNSNERTPPTGELPENNKSRKNKRSKIFYFDDQKHRSLHAKRLGRCMVPKQRRKKHPGLRQVLSPKALYPSAPPGYKVHTKSLMIKYSNTLRLIHY